MNRKRIGLTLVELMIVIILVGVLLGISIFGIGNWRERTATSEVKSDLINGSTALQSHRNFSSSYPANQAEFEQLFSSSDSVDLDYILRGDGSFCLNATSQARPQVQWMLDSNVSVKDPAEGACS